MVSLWRVGLGTSLVAVASTVAIGTAVRMLRGRREVLNLQSPPSHVIDFLRSMLSAPVAVVDADAFAANVRSLVQPLRAAGKAVRIATKSVRSVELVELARKICEDECGVPVQGIMTFTAAESLMWARRRTFSDILLAYPVGTAKGAYDVILCNVENPTKVRCSVVVDSMDQVDKLVAAAEEWIDGQDALVNSFDTSVAAVTIPLVLDVDMSWRPLGDIFHVGVRRSPLRSQVDVQAFLSALEARAEVLSKRKDRIGITLVVCGLMGYEAQIAGLPERTQSFQNSLVSSVMAQVKHVIKTASAREALPRRKQLVDVIAAAGARSPGLVAQPGHFFVNGGGSGSVVITSQDRSVTEVTIGSGLLCGHLFDGYEGNVLLSPCLYFALSICRVSDKGRFVTCSGGGWVASGPPAPDRLPLPVFPQGLKLLVAMEGAGEVQTPLAVSSASDEGRNLSVGSLVVFRPAKSGELGEIFSAYRFVASGAAAKTVNTYRGDAIDAWA